MNVFGIEAAAAAATYTSIWPNEQDSQLQEIEIYRMQSGSLIKSLLASSELNWGPSDFQRDTIALQSNWLSSGGAGSASYIVKLVCLRARESSNKRTALNKTNHENPPFPAIRLSRLAPKQTRQFNTNSQRVI